MNLKKNIAYVSGTRADFGLMTPVLRAIEKSSTLSLQMYATGMHLMPKFGNTIDIVKTEFPSVKIVDAVFEKNTPAGASGFVSDLLGKIGVAFEKDRPDLVLLLGDRPEMLAVAVACLYLGIPTAHIHGGERTATVDEVARHAISKLSSLHLTTTEDSAKRLKKMGEDAWRTHVVGAPALDTILHEKLPTRGELCKRLKLDPSSKFILAVQHPVSDEVESAGVQMTAILSAIKSFRLPVAVIYPNADPGGADIIAEIEKERGNPLFHIFPNIPHTKFLALERNAAVWVGNSSAALIESSSFGTPVVNVGTRQQGRVRGENVIDAGYDTAKIADAIKKSLYDESYRERLKVITNPWGDGKTGEKVARILENLEITARLLSKQIAY